MASSTVLPAPARAPVEPPQPVAPAWHTAMLAGLFILLTIAGAFFQHAARAEPSMVRHGNPLPLYLGVVAAEWSLVYYVWKAGLRRSRTSLREIVGGRWSSPGAVLRDLLLAAGIWLLWRGIQLGWGRLVGPDHAASVEAMLPRAPLEIAGWVLVSASAGFCEEVVFRGYFQRQFAALTRNRAAGLILQALLFGISHGYQGVAACSKIALYGVLFGLVAWWRKSLRPGMLAHTASDVIAGVFRI